MHGCCVVTGLLGSAGNAVDIPIDSDYKLDTEADDFEIKFELLISNIFNQFKRRHGAFDSYRVRILSEPANFESQISKFFLSGT
jgi:hypothetical protein